MSVGGGGFEDPWTTDAIRGKIRWFSYPLYGRTLDGRFTPIGTGMLVWRGFEVYLLTASHILQRLEGSRLADPAPYIFRKNKNQEEGEEIDFVRVAGQMLRTEEHNAPDRVDVGIINIDLETVRNSRLQVLNEARMNTGGPRSRLLYFINGYPGMKSKDDFKTGSGRKHSTECVNYFWGDRYNFDWSLAPDLNQARHVVTRYELGLHGYKTTRPSPRADGFSGGAVWGTPGIFDEEDLKLEAILIEQRDFTGKKHVIGTRTGTAWKRLESGEGVVGGLIE